MFKVTYCIAAALVIQLGSHAFASQNQDILMSCENIQVFDQSPAFLAPAQVLEDTKTGELTIRTPHWDGAEPLLLPAVLMEEKKPVSSDEVGMMLELLAVSVNDFCKSVDEMSESNGMRCSNEYLAKSRELAQRADLVYSVRTWRADVPPPSISSFLYTQMNDKNGQPVIQLVTEFAMGPFYMVCK